MKLPDKIVIERMGQKFTMSIDGVEFTHPIACDGIRTSVSTADLPHVWVKLLASEVKVVNAFPANETRRGASLYLEPEPDFLDKDEDGNVLR